MNQLMTASQPAPSTGMMNSGQEAGPYYNKLIGSGPAPESPISAPSIAAPPPQAPSNQQQLAAEMQRMGALRNVLGGLLQKDKITYRDAFDTLMQATSNKILSPDQSLQAMQSMPRKPEAIADKIADHYLDVSGVHAMGHHLIGQGQAARAPNAPGGSR